MDKNNEIRQYGPGKFDTVLDSLIWDMTLDGGPDEECGDSSMGIWYGRLNGPFTITADLTRAERELVLSSVGIILSEDGQGFVHVEYFDREDQMVKAWTQCEEDAAKFEEQDEDNELPN